MTINIRKEQDITLTQAEHDQYQREWHDSQRMTTNPVSFETWVRRNKIPLGCDNPSCFCTGLCKRTAEEEAAQGMMKAYSK